jgi:hypothetical protein
VKLIRGFVDRFFKEEEPEPIELNSESDTKRRSIVSEIIKRFSKKNTR